MHSHNNIKNKNKNNDNSSRPLDAAGRSLSDALRVSFAILKVIMVVLVVVFLASGLKTVGPGENALVLRFGKIRGLGEKRILKPGLHPLWPYPIHEIVKIPVGRKNSITVDSFWYKDGQDRSKGQSLHPVYDSGYCIIRGNDYGGGTFGAADMDYHIVHGKWQLTYQIDDAEKFFCNVYSREVKPGQIYADVIIADTGPLVRRLAEDAVVAAMVNFSIDQAIPPQAKIAAAIKRILQKKLDTIESGIKVISVQTDQMTWPGQVDKAFNDYFKASQKSKQAIKIAETYAQNTLNQTAGLVAEDLFGELTESKVDANQKHVEQLWSQAAGDAHSRLADARVYRTTVAESAKANADYLKTILPEYKKNPELVVQGLYLDAIEYVFENVDEKIIIQPAKNRKGSEIRILLNRDPKIKSKGKK